MAELAPDGGGSATSPSSPDLDAPTESLQEFKKRVDRLLTELDKSSAAHGKISEQKVTATAYGKNFPEALSLSSAYELVHGRLELLSQTLGEQLEAMGITVSAADSDYQTVDHEHGERLKAIQRRTQAYYEQYQKEHDPKGHDKTGEPKTGGGKSSGHDGM
ncbi:MULTISPECIES: hypothetical protein [Streptomyces]|uniref:Conjugal transfer protein TraB n=1 Tax=Streptomyces luomodiensis TaxID=3026192 RepID=A0ABY9V4K8_9ACTN|nr:MULTISPECIES: hypothetical protein [unclassified Streptomyces]WAP58643.1 hypothetical protein N6H00_28835 [Streptomyces sp. S465]WNE99217.1 hypothetical protein PS467_29750 [Streptomyces sp. SCA4-21]